MLISLIYGILCNKGDNHSTYKLISLNWTRNQSGADNSNSFFFY